MPRTHAYLGELTMLQQSRLKGPHWALRVEKGPVELRIDNREKLDQTLTQVY